jgi:glycine cleavage system H protein
MAIHYTKDHEWISVDGDIGTVGISRHAQEQLGDIVFVELPDVGKAITKGGEAAVVESVKAASDVYAPVTGDVVAVNEALADAPATVNEDAEGKGWFMKVKLKNSSELDDLMTAEQYQDFLKTL